MFSVGCDLEKAERFVRTLQRGSFMREVYTEGERAHIDASPHSAITAAGVWCAKEACAKALGQGLFGLLPRELEVLWDDRGAPRMTLCGSAAVQFSHVQLSVSISHTEDHVMAVVLAETP